jgi:hypothetical protein
MSRLSQPYLITALFAAQTQEMTPPNIVEIGNFSSAAI